MQSSLFFSYLNFLLESLLHSENTENTLTHRDTERTSKPYVCTGLKRIAGSRQEDEYLLCESETLAFLLIPFYEQV